MLRSDNIADIRRLRSFLDERFYQDSLKTFYNQRYFIDPFMKYGEFATVLQLLPKPQQLACRLLYMGDDLQLADARTAFGDEIIDILVRCGFASLKEETLASNGYMLASINDLYLCFQIPYLFPTCQDTDSKIYIGADSLRLINYLEKSTIRRGLDLCSGSGVIACVLAKRATEKVVAVEIQDEAYAAIGFNAALNGLEEIVEPRQGNLFDVIEPDERFDVICSNPPFIAVPEEVRYPIPGDGGPDGMRIMRDITSHLDAHLEPGGSAAFIFEALGCEKEPFYAEELRQLSEQLSLRSLMILHGRSTAEYQAKFIADFTAGIYEGTAASDLFPRWEKLYEELGAKFLYSVTIKMERSESGGLQTLNMTNPWQLSDVPVVMDQPEILEDSTKFGLWRGQRRVAVVDKESLDFFKLIDGQSNVNDILEHLFPSYRDKYKVGVPGMHPAALDLCWVLEGFRFVQRKQ